MPNTNDTIIYVTDPLEFSFDSDGNIECVIKSKARRYIFAMSRHKARNANMVMRALLDKADRENNGKAVSFHPEGPRKAK